jgi:sugar phosphate isomerase/epimerase
MSEESQLSRRGFLGAAGGAAAVGALGPMTAVAGADKRGHGRGHGHDHDDHDDRGRGDLPASRIGLQLFTVRDNLADNELDLTGTFEMLGDAGYALVEVGGSYDGRTPAQVRELARQYGMRPEGMHPPQGGSRWTTPEGRQAIYTESQQLGLRYVGAASPPNGYTRDTAGFTRMAADFNTWGAEARAKGLKFYFHNHPEDFALDPSGDPIYDILLEETDPRLVFFEMDIAWVVGGGQDPYAYLRRYGAHRFPLFHVKDLTFTPPPPPPAPVADRPPRTTPANVAKPGRPYWLKDVGKGEIDFAHIFSALRDTGDHYYFVEHDDAPDDETVDPAIRPRNPAGSANTSWTSAKYLLNLRVSRRRR